MSFMKTRGSGKHGTGNFGGSSGTRRSGGMRGRSQQSGSNRRKKMPAGMFERWYPQEISMWMRIPPQLWQYQIWEDFEVFNVEEAWFEYVNHFIAGIKRSFICSAGVERDQPCFGCAIRNNFYNEKRRIEEETGVKEEKWAPISASKRFAFAVTCLEQVFAVPLRDGKGKIRRSKQDKIIYNYIPKPVHEMDEHTKTPKSKRGHNFHWSMGSEHFQQLADYDLAFQNKDALTGDDLLMLGLACENCEEPIHMFDDLLTGEDITEWRIKEVGCPHCGHKATQVPLLRHPENTEFKQGSITAFDIRVKAVPIGNDKTAIKIVDARVPEYEDEDLIKLTTNPLNIAEIFASTDVGFQQRLLGDMAKGVNPKDGVLAKAYNSQKDDEGGDIPYGGNDEDDSDE